MRFFQAASTSSSNVPKVYPISSHFVSSSSRMEAFVEEVLCSSTIAPGWIRPRSFSKASSLRAVYPDTSPHKPGSRKTCDIPDLLPSGGFLYCRSPVADGKILSFLFQLLLYKEPPHLPAVSEKPLLWRCRTYPGGSWCDCQRYGLHPQFPGSVPVFPDQSSHNKKCGVYVMFM